MLRIEAQGNAFDRGGLPPFLFLKKKADGMGGDGFTVSCKAKPLLGRRFHIHSIGPASENRRDLGTHPGNIRGKLRPLGNDGRIDISDTVTSLIAKCGDPSGKHAAVGTDIRRIGIRKMPTDIALTESPKDGIHHRMEQAIGIRMSKEAALIRDPNSTKDQGALLYQAMNVVSMSDLKRGHFGSSSSAVSRATSPFAIFRSLGVVIFRISLRAATIRTR